MSSMPYREQVSLLLRVLPIVGRDLPRLSVDIDLTFLPLVERNEALVGIRDALQHIAARGQESDPRGHRQRLATT